MTKKITGHIHHKIMDLCASNVNVHSSKGTS